MIILPAKVIQAPVQDRKHIDLQVPGPESMEEETFQNDKANVMLKGTAIHYLLALPAKDRDRGVEAATSAVEANEIGGREAMGSTDLR